MDNTKQKLSTAAERRLRIATAILSVYKPKTLALDAFDQIFGTLISAAEYLEGAYHNAKRAHIYAARGLESCMRIANRMSSYVHSAERAIGAGINCSAVLQQQLTSTYKVARAPKLQDIVLDLKAMERDFPSVKYEDSISSLIVTTDPITLEYMGMSFDFGEFQITLDMTAVAAKASKPYEIRAVNPRWTPDHAYCHPHLTGRDLCAGDGGTAALRATAEGRLYDFFVIINQILNTYNPDSPYAKLDVWVNGEYDREDDEDTGVCDICDERIALDDLYSCSNCDQLICENCSSYCGAQDATYCSDCISEASCACSMQGGNGCVVEENDPCLSCGEIPSNDNLHTCEHMYNRAATYGGRSHSVSMCTACAQKLADDRRPCMLSEYITREDGTRAMRTVPCPEFGTEYCMLVIDMDMEEEEEPESESEEAETPAEQGAASASD